MLVPNEMGFSYNDLYPGMSKSIETSNLATPETDDLEALNEDTKITDEATPKGASGKSIFLAFGVLVALIIFFGGGK